MHTLARTLVVAALDFAPGVVGADAEDNPYRYHAVIDDPHQGHAGHAR